MDDQTSDKEQRKEVFDYLRQLQKREEQSAKVSGMSGWVLVAAACYLTAWLLEHSTALASMSSVLMGMSFGLCYVFLRLLISPRRPQTFTTGTRINQFVSEDSSMVGLNVCIIGLSPIAPSLASYLLLGWTFAVGYATFLSVAYVLIFVLGPLTKPLVKKQYFRTVSSSNKWEGVLMPLLTIAAFILHTFQLYEVASPLPKEQIVFSGYIAALWWTIHQLTRTLNVAATIEGYAQMEEALVFGLATPKEVLRRLELQTFGPSLEHDLRDLEVKIEDASTTYAGALKEFEQALGGANEVPADYMHERTERLRIAFTPVSEYSVKLRDAIEEKAEYINSLLFVRSTSLDPTVKQLLVRETERLRQRLNSLKSEAKSVQANVQVATAR